MSYLEPLGWLCHAWHCRMAWCPPPVHSIATTLLLSLQAAAFRWMQRATPRRTAAPRPRRSWVAAWTRLQRCRWVQKAAGSCCCGNVGFVLRLAGWKSDLFCTAAMASVRAPSLPPHSSHLALLWPAHSNAAAVHGAVADCAPGPGRPAIRQPVPRVRLAGALFHRCVQRDLHTVAGVAVHEYVSRLLGPAPLCGELRRPAAALAAAAHAAAICQCPTLHPCGTSQSLMSPGLDLLLLRTLFSTARHRSRPGPGAE